LVLLPANVPDVMVPTTSVAAAALVVVNEITDWVPSFQVTVALPDEEPLPHPSDPLPVAEIEPLVIPATPSQLLRVPENV
jgi:hypothetical protein